MLTIYSPAGAVLFTASTTGLPHTFVDTMTGVGNSGFVFGLTATEAATAQGFFGSTNLIGLSASASDATGGPETFFVANTGTPRVIPEPASLLLLGSGLAGLGAWRWKKGRV